MRCRPCSETRVIRISARHLVRLRRTNITTRQEPWYSGDVTGLVIDVQSLFDHHEPGAIAQLFRVINRYVGNLPAMPALFADYPDLSSATLGPNGNSSDALGHAPTARHRWTPVTNIRNTVVTALARLAEA